MTVTDPWRRTLLWGLVLAGLSVAAGAFGTHGLSGRLAPGPMAVFETAVTYQRYHALALVALAALPGTLISGVWQRRAGRALVAGILLFSGSLYALAFGAPHWLGMVTPLGGLLLIAGWALAIAGVWQAARNGR